MVTILAVLCVETSLAGSHVEMLSRPFLALDTLPIKLVHAPWNELMVDSRTDTRVIIPISVIDLIYSLGSQRRSISWSLSHQTVTWPSPWEFSDRSQTDFWWGLAPLLFVPFFWNVAAVEYAPPLISLERLKKPPKLLRSLADIWAEIRIWISWIRSEFHSYCAAAICVTI
jgi:hypothetical protein